MSDRERRQINLEQFYAAGAADPLVCPGCGARRFVVTSTFWTRPDNGPRVKRRLRKCAECGHAHNETVPPAVPDEVTNHKEHEEHQA